MRRSRPPQAGQQLMHAEIIAVGTELLAPSKLDTNSLYLARRLAERGILLVRKSVVGDDRKLLADEIRRSRDASEVVILTGGLGPTLDDLTREAASDATGRTLRLSQAVVKEIEERFRTFNRPMAEVNKRQAYVLEGAAILHNPRGTAPGQWLKDKHGILILLPGPPRELEPMFEEACLPLLDRNAPPYRFHTLTLRVAGIGESDVDQRIGEIYSAEARVVDHDSVRSWRHPNPPACAGRVIKMKLEPLRRPLARRFGRNWARRCTPRTVGPWT